MIIAWGEKHLCLVQTNDHWWWLWLLLNLITAAIIQIDVKIPAVNLLITEPAFHYTLSWENFFIDTTLLYCPGPCHHHFAKNNHCLYCHVNVDIWTALVHKGELGIVMIKVQSSSLKSSPDCKHLNCPGLHRGVGQEDGSSLPSMQSVEPSQCLGVIMMMMMMIMKDELWSLVDEQYVAMFKLDNIRNTVKLEW